MESNNKKANTPFLSVKDLVVEYTADGEVIHAVNGVSFELQRGRTLGLVGETGAGKTTIAKTILGILPEFSAKVKGGEVLVDGQNLLAMSERDMQKIQGKKISMIFQDPMTALNPVLTVGKQIAEAIKRHDKVNWKEANERAKKMLEMVGITSERFIEYPHQFSGGMKQRVIIAMALACSPELLLADEPTTALDVTIQAQVLDMINRLKTEFNTAMIMITHDFGIVAEVCDDVMVVYAGEIIESGSREDIFDHPMHPYTRGLFGSIPSLKGTVRRLSPIKGLPPDPSALPKGCHFSPRCPNAIDACKVSKIPMTEVSPGHLCRCVNMKEEV
jgi:peptide/nickel transport system ATP-binding protein